MILPTDKLVLEDGRSISVRRIEETGGGTTADGRDVDTALYRDRDGNFYTVFLVQKSVDECLRITNRAEFEFPADRNLYDSINEHCLTTRNVDERGALNWYIEEFVNEGPVKTLLRQVAADIVPKYQRKGKSPVTAWVSPRVQKQLRAIARSNSRTQSAQLECFALEGLTRVQKRARRDMLPGQSLVQLHLVTALVSVVRAVARTKTPAAQAAADDVLDALEPVRETA
jgi:hypothetical protein